MFGYIGGNPDAMVAFANDIRRRREGIRKATRRLGRLLEQADWHGPDRERFVAEWQGRHEPTLIAMIDDLGTAASQIEQHACRQREASQ